MASSKTSETALSSVASRPKAAGGGTVAVLIAAQQESELKMQKLITTIQKLQQENAEAVQRAGQAGAGAATAIANQVAAGIEKASDANQRSSERAEDKAFAREQQQLNADLQKQAARDAAAMGAAIQASREKYVNSIHALEKNEADFDESIATYESRLEEASRRGVFASPAGRKKLAKMENTIRMARIHRDNMFDDRHMRKAHQTWNDELKSITSGSDDPFAVLNTATDPINLPMIEMKGERQNSTPDTMIGEDKFQLELASGYPPNGVMFDPEGNNFGLPEGVNPNVLNPRTMLDLLSDFENERAISDKGLRQEYRIGAQRSMIENSDRIAKMKDTYKSVNLVYGTKATGAVEAALEDFLTDQNPAKLNNPSRYIMTRSLVHMFGGGKEGEEMAVIGLEFFDGKREARSEADFAMLMSMESATFFVQKHLATEVLNADGTTGSFATELIADMTARVGRDGMLRQLGIDPRSGAALVEAQSVMQDMVLQTRGMARRMNSGMKNSGLMKQFKNHYVSNLQRMDIQAYRMNAEKEQVVNRLGVMVEQLNRPLDQGGPNLDQLQTAAEANASQFEGSMTLVDAFVGLFGGMGPDMHTQISAFLVNELDPVTVSDASGYTDQSRVEGDRTPYSRATGLRTRHAYENTIAGRERSANQQVGEAFEGGGVPGAVGAAVRNIPPLLEMAGRGVAGVVTSQLAGTAKLAGGNPLVNQLQLGAGIAGGKLPLLTPSERDRISNLSPGEISQITQESSLEN